MTALLGSVVVSADGTVVITQNNIPAPAAALGFTNKVIDLVPTKSMISPARTGNYEFFDNIFYSPDPVDVTQYSDSADGLVIPLGKEICSQTRDSTQGKLPYLDGSKGFYIEAMIKSSDNNSLNWEAFWLMPWEHDLVPTDIYASLNAGLPTQQYPGYERWCEIDIYEGGFIPGQLTSVINWHGQFAAPDPYGYGGNVYNNYGDGTGQAFDKTQFHKFALSYDGVQTMVWYRDDVEVFRAVGDSIYNTNSIVPPAAALQHFYMIFGAQTHDTSSNPHNFSMTIGRVQAFVPPPPPSIALLVGYGDSIMYGTGTTNGELGLAWFQMTANTAGLNYDDQGHGGEGSGQIRDRFVSQVGSYDVFNDIFILQGGYNNFWYEGIPGSLVSDDFTTMVNALLALNPNARFLIMGVYVGDDGTGHFFTGQPDRLLVNQINDTLRNRYGDWAAGGNWVDVNRYLITHSQDTSAQDNLDVSPSHDIVPSSARADVIHPDDKGHARISELMLSVLRLKNWIR